MFSDSRLCPLISAFAAYPSNRAVIFCETYQRAQYLQRTFATLCKAEDAIPSVTLNSYTGFYGERASSPSVDAEWGSLCRAAKVARVVFTTRSDAWYHWNKGNIDLDKFYVAGFDNFDICFRPDADLFHCLVKSLQRTRIAVFTSSTAGAGDVENAKTLPFPTLNGAFTVVGEMPSPTTRQKELQKIQHHSVNLPDRPGTTQYRTAWLNRATARTGDFKLLIFFNSQPHAERVLEELRELRGAVGASAVSKDRGVWPVRRPAL